MSDLKNYKATINGIEHTFLLNDVDAKARGLDPAKDAVSEEPLATTPLNFAEPTTDGQDTEAKAREAANKSRTAATK